MKLLCYAYQFFRRLFFPISTRRTYKTIFTTDKPNQLAPHVVYIVGDKRPWLLMMLCPCGCGACINLNLLPEDYPCWHLTHHPDTTLSVHPSIWRTAGCRSHFFLKRGSIIWHQDF